MCFSGATDGSNPDDLFQLGVDVLGLDILDIVYARVSEYHFYVCVCVCAHITVVKYTNNKQKHCLCLYCFSGTLFMHLQ